MTYLEREQWIPEKPEYWFELPWPVRAEEIARALSELMYAVKDRPFRFYSVMQYSLQHGGDRLCLRARLA